MFVSWPILVTLGLGFFLIGTVVGQLSECLHLPDSLAEERDLAQLALPALFRSDRRARQHSDRELDRLAGRVPRLRCADLDAVSAGGSAWWACCFWGPIWST